MARQGIFFLAAFFCLAWPARSQYQTVSPDTAICLGSSLVLTSSVLPAAGTTKYTFQHVNYNWQLPDSTTYITDMGDDEVRGPLPIGFTFNFLCINYTHFYLGSNGWISFGVKNENSFHPQSIPDVDPLTPKNAIMAPWADWNTNPNLSPPHQGSGNITYGVKGAAPNRRLIVSWNNNALWGNQNLKGTFQIVIYEGTNIIENNIQSVPLGGLHSTLKDATQGVHNMTGTLAYVAFGRNATNWNASNESTRFIPGVASTQITWTKLDSNGLMRADGTVEQTTADSIVVIPPVSCKYLSTLVTCSGFREYDTVDVKVMPAVKVFASADTTICKGQQVLLKAAGTHGHKPSYAFVWDGNDSVQNVIVQPDSTRTYKVTLDDNCSAKPDSDYVTVHVRPPLKIQLFSDTIICNGKQVLVSPVLSGGFPPGYKLKWGGSDSGFTKSYSPTADTVYKVVLTDGCTSAADSSLARFHVRAPLKVTAMADTTVCSGFPVTLHCHATGGDSTAYSFAWNDSLAGQHVVTSTDSSAMFRVVLDDGCTTRPDTDVVNIRVRFAPTMQARADSTICDGQAVRLFAEVMVGDTDGVTFNWKNFAPGLNSVLVIPQQTSTYIVEMKDRCVVNPVTDTTVITVRPPLKVNAPSDTTICFGRDIIMQGSGSGGFAPGYDFRWSNGDQGSVMRDFGLKKDTVYKIVLTDHCTVKSDSAYVRVHVGPPIVVSVNDTLVCEGSSVSIMSHISGGQGPGFTFEWSNSLTTPGITITADTTRSYIVKVDDNCSISAYDTAVVEAEPLPDVNFDAAEHTIVCARKSFSLVNLSACRPGSGFVWNFGDSDTSHAADPEHTYAAPGNYDVGLTVTSPLGCSDSLRKTAYIRVDPTPVVVFAADREDVDVYDNRVEFFAAPMAGRINYHWTFGDDKGYTDVAQPAYHFDQPGIYRVTLAATNELGCTDVFSKDIRVFEIYSLYVPTAFTPNDDQLNDRLEAKGRGIISFELKVVNRLGDVMFESNDMAVQWDGKDRDGNVAESDTYWCQVVATDVRGKEHMYRGKVSLLR